MITKGMGLTRQQVYIANILKCRPPENRTPSYGECASCVGYLEQQIAIIRPEFICMLGLIAAQTLLETTQSLGRLRGQWHSYRGIRTIVTYHPAYLLRSPSFKKQAWEDLQTLMKAMGLALPKTRGRARGMRAAASSGRHAFERYHGTLITITRRKPLKRRYPRITVPVWLCSK